MRYAHAGRTQVVGICIRLFFFLLVSSVAGCGGGSGSGTGSTGGSGGGSSFEPRPFPGDYFVTPPAPEYPSTFPGNVVYDSMLKEFFFSNPGMNEVEAYSSIDGHRVGAVSVPGCIGLSLSPDGSELAVGTSTPHLYFVDPTSLHVTNMVEVPAALLNPGAGLEPIFPFLMAAAPILIELTQPNPDVTSEVNLISYDPVSGAFAQINPPGVSVGFEGPEPARSLDGEYLAVPTLGQMFLYSAQSQTYIGSTPEQYNIGAVAANPDGSQFAMVGTTSFSDKQSITFWNRSLQEQAKYSTQDTNIVYSRDGKYLYARELRDVLALDTQDGLPTGYQGLSIGTDGQGLLWDTDESNRVFGITDLGAFVLSAAHLQPTAPTMPQFTQSGSPFGNPNEGPLSGGTQVQFVPTSVGAGSEDGLGSTVEAYFGSAPAVKDVVAPYSYSSDGRNFLTATAPAFSITGPVTVLMTDSNNNASLLPAAYSYGPHAHWINPSAVSSNGTTISSVLADGVLPAGSNNPSVTVAGVPAGLVGASSLGLEFIVPSGKPGWADFKLSLSDGTSETTNNMVQYLAQDVTLPSPAYTAAVYDSSRDRFYMTGADNTVGVFDPESQTLLQSMQSTKISSGAVLGSLSITPDNSRLLVSDPTDASVLVFDLTNGTSTAVNVLTASDGAASISAPMPVVTLKGDSALVLLSGLTQNELRQIDLAQMTVKVRTDLQSTPLVHNGPSTMASSMDGSMALLGGTDANALYAWRYDTASDAFSSPAYVTSTSGDTVAVNADGTVLGINAFTLGQDLAPLVPIRFTGLSNLLTGAGGLEYSAASQVRILDTRNGRSRLTMPPLPTSAGAFAVDPSGRKILVCAGASLTYYELAVIPLAVGTVSPAQAAPGAPLTIRGDGFVAGTNATIAGKSAACTLVDEQTIQCIVPNVAAGLAPMELSNPDGQTYSFEAGVNVQ